MISIIEYILAISGITTSAILLGRYFINKAFDFGLEKYKSSLQMEIEEHKSSLTIANLEHQIRFSRLHETRAEKISQLFSMVVELEKKLIHSTTPVQGPEYGSDHERDNDAVIKLRELITLLDLNRIYFTVETIQKFESIFKESWDIIAKMRKVRSYASAIDNSKKYSGKVPDWYYEETDKWLSIYERTQNEFKELKEDLANEFRILLGK